MIAVLQIVYTAASRKVVLQKCIDSKINDMYDKYDMQRVEFPWLLKC